MNDHLLAVFRNGPGVMFCKGICTASAVKMQNSTGAVEEPRRQQYKTNKKFQDLTVTIRKVKQGDPSTKHEETALPRPWYSWDKLHF